MFRLELLENIFSLLFLSTADFTQQSQKDSNQNSQSECLSDTRNTSVELGTKAKKDETENSQKLCSSSPTTAHSSHLELGHFIQGCRGFLADVTAMAGFLKLLKEGLEGMCVVGQQEGQEAGRALPQEAEVAESLGCSVTAETFGARLQRLSKRTAEAQWRLQIISSNQSSGSGEMDNISVYLSTCVCVCMLVALGVDEFRYNCDIYSLICDGKFTCRFRKSCPDVRGQLSCRFCGTQQELEPEEKEETRETCDRETDLSGETQWRS